MKREQVRELWAERMAAFALSSHDIKSWCVENNHSVAAFHYWRSKLSLNPPCSSTKEDWLALRICDDTRTASSAGVTLDIGNVMIDLQQDFDPLVLRRVLEIVGGKVC